MDEFLFLWKYDIQKDGNKKFENEYIWILIEIPILFSNSNIFYKLKKRFSFSFYSSVYSVFVFVFELYIMNKENYKIEFQ